MPTIKFPVFFPTIKGRVQPYLSNVKIQLAPLPTGGGLATKYSLDATKVTRISTLLTDIPNHLNQAAQLHDQAEQQTELANQKIREANLLNHEFGATMQKDAAFDISDFDLIGYRVTETAPDPTQAKVKITHVTLLPDMIRFDWAKESWAGIRIYGSLDGAAYTFLDKDDRSPWEDKRFNKENFKPETRYYRFRHVDKDGNEIGDVTTMEVVAAIYNLTSGHPLSN